MTKRVKWLTRAVKQPVRDLYMQGIRGKHECEKERSGKFSEDTTELLKLKHISITSDRLSNNSMHCTEEIFGKFSHSLFLRHIHPNGTSDNDLKPNQLAFCFP